MPKVVLYYNQGKGNRSKTEQIGDSKMDKFERLNRETRDFNNRREVSRDRSYGDRSVIGYANAQTYKAHNDYLADYYRKNRTW